MDNIKRPFLLFCVGFGLAAGALIAALNPGEQAWIGFLSGALLNGVSAFTLGWVWQRMRGSRSLAWAVALAFLLRLALGIFLFIALPVMGYDEDPTNAGYLYLDAYRRDTDAWQLAQSGAPLTSGFQEAFTTDQYGGLLSLSAALYRGFSPDAHRPLLVLVLTSFISALGLPFLWAALKERFGQRIAILAAWLYALYPESLVLGASQMREPMLIGLSAISAWGVMRWRHNRKGALIALSASLAGMLLLSSKAAAALCIVLVIWFWLDNIQPNANRSVRMLGIGLLILSLLAGVFYSWAWLVDSSRYDLYLMESSSGRIQWEVEMIGERFRVPFIIGYGMAQPVLPAAIVYPGIAINRAIAIFRSLGWYLLSPLLLTGFLLLFKEKSKEDRRLIFFFLIASLVWTLISSTRAGGDQWDNPRYRSIFLIWMILPAAWAFTHTLQKRFPWLWRLLALEFIYIAFFIQWYLSRYFGVFKRLDFWVMVRLLGGLGFLIIFGGLALDWLRRKCTTESD